MVVIESYSNFSQEDLTHQYCAFVANSYSSTTDSYDGSYRPPTLRRFEKTWLEQQRSKTFESDRVGRGGSAGKIFGLWCHRTNTFHKSLYFCQGWTSFCHQR